MSLRASAHTGVAIRSPSLCRGYPEQRRHERYVCMQRKPQVHLLHSNSSAVSSWVTTVIAKVAEGHLWQSVLLHCVEDTQNKGGARDRMYAAFRIPHFYGALIGGIRINCYLTGKYLPPGGRCPRRGRMRNGDTLTSGMQSNEKEQA